MNVNEFTTLPEIIISVKDGEKDKSALKWSGTWPIPKIGDTVDVKMNAFGAGEVVSYFSNAGFLGIKVRLYNPPDFYVKQQRQLNREYQHGNFYGADIVARPYVSPIKSLIEDGDLVAISSDQNTGLYSLKLKARLCDGECMDLDPAIPHIDLDELVEGGTQTHERRAAIESSIDPELGYPGDEAVFRYIENHRYMLKKL